MWTDAERRVLRRLDRPWKIQDFLGAIPMNFADTYHSPRLVLRERRASCLEGALLAAAAFAVHGQRPLLLDLRSIMEDDDHVVALFRYRGRWGAVSQTNHAVLRYRDPIYRTARELACSYFHEYFVDDGRKTLREYSQPFDLTRPQFRGWMTTTNDLRDLADALDASPHTALLTPAQTRILRPADPIERRAGAIVAWAPPH
ncbi:hypothetical protein HY480_01350 [Candidatus Uhrbacteria bacterium]|nr:hypothetical protein [Candidatus Uhrbacteria bacterium]